MAIKYQNNKNFSIIKMTWKECVAITDSWALCDLCGQNSCEEPLYYIALINQFYCQTCFDAWISGAKRYSSDLEKEQYNYIKIKNKLIDLGTWEQQMIERKEMERVNNCVFCKSKPVVIHYSYNMWYVQCKGCDKHDLYAYLGSSEAAAIEQWNFMNREGSFRKNNKDKNDKNNHI